VTQTPRGAPGQHSVLDALRGPYRSHRGTLHKETEPAGVDKDRVGGGQGLVFEQFEGRPSMSAGAGSAAVSGVRGSLVIGARAPALNPRTWRALPPAGHGYLRRWQVDRSNNGTAWEDERFLR
jgi:hypothetical protein